MRIGDHGEESSRHAMAEKNFGGTFAMLFSPRYAPAMCIVGGMIALCLANFVYGVVLEDRKDRPIIVSKEGGLYHLVAAANPTTRRRVGIYLALHEMSKEGGSLVLFRSSGLDMALSRGLGRLEPQVDEDYEHRLTSDDRARLMAKPHFTELFWPRGSREDREFVAIEPNNRLGTNRFRAHLFEETLFLVPEEHWSVIRGDGAGND